jgi:hypothetical protein
MPYGVNGIAVLPEGHDLSDSHVIGYTFPIAGNLRES